MCVQGYKAIVNEENFPVPTSFLVKLNINLNKTKDYIFDAVK